jgi:hypothetical protein
MRYSRDCREQSLPLTAEDLVPRKRGGRKWDGEVKT